MSIIEKDHECDPDCTIWSNKMNFSTSGDTIEVSGQCPECHREFVEVYIAYGIQAKDTQPSPEYLIVYK